MGLVLTPESLASEIAGLASGKWLQEPARLLAEANDLLTPPENISTVDCAEEHRNLPGNEDGAVVRYDRMRTPYNVGPMNSLDNPACQLMVMVKPSRSGGTTVAENFVFKMIKYGPAAHVAWVLNSDEAVTDYCRNVVKPMFDLNDDIRAAIDEGRGNDTDGYKQIRGYPFEWLSAKDSTFRNRQPWFMVSDETDAWAKKYARTPRTQIEGRQKLLGNRRKGAIMSHPDLGYTSGVTAAYEDTSRGIFIMQCLECLGYAAAFATKFWRGVPQFKLDWTRSDSASNDDRLDLAERTGRMHCPHCGVGLTDEQRRQMVDKALTGGGNAIDGWMHRGQTLDALEGVIGEMEPNDAHGFWVHGLMLKSEDMGKLAREYEAALIDYERTRDPSKLREFLSKKLGEVFEGKAGIAGVNASTLQERAKEEGFSIGEFPADARFITAAIDIGGGKFDVSFRAWDEESRSWWLDRITIRQRRWPDGTLRDVRPSERIEDWDILIDEVISRRFAIEDRPGWVMPVAQVSIDASDGNVTWKAREFAARCMARGLFWGPRAKPWAIVQLIQGSPSAKAPILPPKARLADAKGRRFPKGVQEWTVGAHKSKEQALERLAVTDGGPGQCFFANAIARNYFDEYFNEPLIDGKFVRQGPNESLDLFGYEEMARLMLKPDRKDIDWKSGKFPVWATAIEITEKPEEEHQKPTDKPAKADISRWTNLNSNNRKR